MLNVNNVYKKFGDKTVLNGISLSVNQGEIVGVLGANGAGKTTLMRIISTLMTSDGGEISVNGYMLGKDNDKIRKSIGVLIGSEVGLYDLLTAEENIEYFAALNGLTPKEARQETLRLADVLGFKDYLNKRTRQLSRGMKQKVSFARAIVHNPKLMLLDEPESGLDFAAAKTVFDFMRNCKSEGKAVFFSSHSMENIKLCSDRIVFLKDGKIAGNINMNEMRQSHTDAEINEKLYRMIEGSDK